ncbi:TAP-like domain containing protein [Naviculisporaceae sp. PSN 640]
MLFIRLSLCHLLLASAAVAYPTTAHHSVLSQSKIEWQECSSVNSAWDCGNVTVPLDYTDASSNETHLVQLWRSKAINPPAKGSILFNFGGPGVSGLDVFRDHSHYHGFAGNLRFSCFGTQEERDNDNHDRDTFIRGWNLLEGDLVESWAHRQAYANLCWNANKDKRVGELIGTTFVARDMINIVDALGEDGMLRYWGFSYGSILGATVAAMFPDRVHRIILDGVVNVFEYYDRLKTDARLSSNHDAAYRTLLSECLSAGPDNCALALDVEKDIPIGQQAWALATRIQLLVDRLTDIPILVNTTVIDGDDVANLRLKFIRWETDHTDPREVALILHYLLNNENLTQVVEFLTSNRRQSSETGDPRQFDDNLAEALNGIKCSDKTGRTGRAENVHDAIAEARTIGKNGEFLAWVPAASTALCAKWPWKSKESFNTSTLKIAGGLRTKNPVLLIGNTIDVKTSIENARNLSTYLTGSVVLEQKVVGHCSNVRWSNCTRDVVTRYFLDGILPKNGTICEPDTPLFHNEKNADEGKFPHVYRAM